MDPATILVLLLSSGVVALLVWFEVNSRRNEATKQQKSDRIRSWFEASARESQTKAEFGNEKKKAA